MKTVIAVCSSDDMERYAAIASLERSQALVRQLLSARTLPNDEEVRLRVQMADSLIKTFDQLQHEQFIHDAVEHLEVVLRKAPQSSPDYSKHLDSLAQARTSEYMITGSSHALDMAVKAAREALELAITSNLQTHDPETQSSIVNNLSYALSRRHASSGDLSDLDEAIVYTRMLYEGATRDSDRHFMSLNNLVSQLQRRVEQAHDDDIELEVEALLNNLAANTTHGTLRHGIATGQLGFIAFKKFKSNSTLENLDRALDLCKAGFDALPTNHETRVDILIAIVDLYSFRHEFEKVVPNLERLVHYSELLSEAIPTGHRLREEHLLKHARRLKEYATRVASLESIDDSIQRINMQLSKMPVRFVGRKECQNILSDLLGMRYTLTNDIQDLTALVEYLEAITSEHTASSEFSGSLRRLASIEWIWELKFDLTRIRKGSGENVMRELAEQEVLGMFVSYYEPDKATIDVLDHVYQSYGVRLHVIADAIDALQTLSEAEISLRTERMKSEKAASHGIQAQPLALGNGEYEAFGSRSLATDQETGDIIFNIDKEMMHEILGYDPRESLSLSKQEFIIREARMEQRAIEKARSKGRRPNLDLCRMCRDIAKPLQRTDDGYQLTAKNIYLPFGNFYQLSCRRHCSLCRLILSAITTETGELHPQLGAIDEEVQATRLLTGTLSSGEKVMRIEYGLKHVGDIRVVSPQNHHQAITQTRRSEGQNLLEKDMKTHAALKKQHSEQQLDPMLVKSWLDDCDHNHGESCASARVNNDGDEMSMLFIDVVEDCLVAAISQKRYFALSYVWGQVDISKTTKDNCQQRQEPQALSAVPFPKTIRDAMRLVRSLGERFLWVDAICMVQDDREQMDRDIPKMNIVYGRAYANIVALYGDNADAGLPGVSPETRGPQLVESLTVSRDSTNLDYDPQDDKSETICLTVTPRPLNFELDIAKWNTRGWVFQERLLSRRCLYFSPNAVYFQCASKTLSEYGINEEYTPMLFDSVPQRPRPVSTRAARDNAFDLLDLLQGVRSEEERVIKAFSIYSKLVESYSRREFSFKSDVINGFAGVFATLEKHFHSETHGGLPAAMLVHALLWTPAGRLPRRGMRLPTPSDIRMGKPDMQFPSWSWAGWDGPVDYHLFEETEGILHLPMPLVTHYRVGKDSTIIRTDDQTDVSGARTETSRDTSLDKSLQTKTHDAGLSGGTPREKSSSSSKGKEAVVHGESNKMRTAVKLLADPARGTTWTVAPPQSSDPWDPPLESNILTFTAPTVPISAFRVSPEKEYLIQRHHVHTQGKQAVRRICDRQGSHCGLWWEQAGYGYVGLSLDARAETRIHMVGISGYGDTERRREGPSRVEGEIRLFDDQAFPAIDLNSGLVNVLVVDIDLENRRAVGYRVTVAVVHVKAWTGARPKVSSLRVA